jgi:hypothetical protein
MEQFLSTVGKIAGLAVLICAAILWFIAPSWKRAASTGVALVGVALA